MSASGERTALDVSGLPTVADGPRAPLWWGVTGIMAIEGAMFAILAATYFYLRGAAVEWPPTGVRHPGLGITTLNLAILLASIIPMYLVARAAARQDLKGCRLWLIVSTVLMVAFLAVRGFILTHLTFRWDSHAYGSVVWIAAALHTTHVLTGTGENLLFITLLYKGPVEDKHMVDLRLNSMYWYFVVLAWAAFYCIFFLDPGLLQVR
ncbi:MAG TPA: cytochrome c oxidase subunit 3 [Thermoanaerobaculia bacterium]|jgi:cytochrome c oxidase subunit I+III|nr:cytochrome c oxidase subunit 3 [Thermoanaerobaculia bacterium]